MKDYRTITLGWPVAPYFRRYSRDLASKPAILLKKSWVGYCRTTLITPYASWPRSVNALYQSLMPLAPPSSASPPVSSPPSYGVPVHVAYDALDSTPPHNSIPGDNIFQGLNLSPGCAFLRVQRYYPELSRSPGPAWIHNRLARWTHTINSGIEGDAWYAS